MCTVMDSAWQFTHGARLVDSGCTDNECKMRNKFLDARDA
jgi:hypothetical protein